MEKKSKELLELQGRVSQLETQLSVANKQRQAVDQVNSQNESKLIEQQQELSSMKRELTLTKNQLEDIVRENCELFK